MPIIELDEDQIVAIIEEHLVRKYKRVPNRITLFFKQNKASGENIGAIINIDRSA